MKIKIMNKILTLTKIKTLKNCGVNEQNKMQNKVSKLSCLLP